MPSEPEIDHPHRPLGHPRRPLRLLAIGTSTDWCSVALHLRDADGVRVACADERAGQSQSRRLLPMIESLLRENGLAMADLDAIAFDAGPGAFTSLRIGCGVAQGLGFALSIPLIPVGSLEALAEQGSADWTFVATDARMDEVYWAILRRADGLPVAVRPAGARRVDDAQGMIADWRAALVSGRVAPAVFGEDSRSGPASPAADASVAPTVLAIGDAFGRHPALREAAVAAGLPVSAARFPEARAIARLAAARFDAGETLAARDAAPIYVRDKVALDVNEQRALRQARSEGSAGLRQASSTPIGGASSPARPSGLSETAVGRP